MVLGEQHHPLKPMPARAPTWLTIPERGLFTGIAVIGAVGSGKTSGCLYPYAEQVLGYRGAIRERRIGGLVLEVKGDFCHDVRGLLDRARPRGGLPRGQSRRSASATTRCTTTWMPTRWPTASPRCMNNLFGQGQGAVLAAGVHEPGQVHDPAAQGRSTTTSRSSRSTSTPSTPTSCARRSRGRRAPASRSRRPAASSSTSASI